MATEGTTSKRFGLTTQQQRTLGLIHSYLLGVLAEREIMGQYTLVHAVDETLALLSGEGDAKTYFGFQVELGPSVLNQLSAMRQDLQEMIDDLEEEE